MQLEAFFLMGCARDETGEQRAGNIWRVSETRTNADKCRHLQRSPARLTCE